MAGEVAREETNPKTWTGIGGPGVAPVPGGPGDSTVCRRTSCLGSAGRGLCWPSVLLLEAHVPWDPKISPPPAPRGACLLLASAPVFRGDSNTREFAHLVIRRARQARTVRERRQFGETVLPSTLGAGEEPALVGGVGWLFRASQTPGRAVLAPSRVRAAPASV